MYVSAALTLYGYVGGKPKAASEEAWASVTSTTMTVTLLRAACDLWLCSRTSWSLGLMKA